MTVKIIETNLVIFKKGTPESFTLEMADHQARVIEFSGWEDYVSVYKENKFVIANPLLGSMSGSVIPREAKIDNLKYDDFHLSCDVTSHDENLKSRTLAYLI